LELDRHLLAHAAGLNEISPICFERLAAAKKARPYGLRDLQSRLHRFRPQEQRVAAGNRLPWLQMLRPERPVSGRPYSRRSRS
jgi:hypothetical protein